MWYKVPRPYCTQLCQMSWKTFLASIWRIMPSRNQAGRLKASVTRTVSGSWLSRSWSLGWIQNYDLKAICTRIIMIGIRSMTVIQGCMFDWFKMFWESTDWLEFFASVYTDLCYRCKVCISCTLLQLEQRFRKFKCDFFTSQLLINWFKCRNFVLYKCLISPI